MRVLEVMTKKPVILKKTDSIQKAMELFAKKKISGCPVVHRCRVVGIFTQFDVINTIAVRCNMKVENIHSILFSVLRSNDFEKVLHKFRNLSRSKIEDYMQRSVVTINQNHDIYKAARIMNAENINRIPVVDSMGRLTGIISRQDIIDALSRK